MTDYDEEPGFDDEDDEEEPELSIAERSLILCSLFEAEVFVRLILAHWNHPFKDDAGFAGTLLETAGEVLQQSITGAEFMEDVDPEHMNLVSSIWYAEWAAVSSGNEVEESGKRWAWLQAVKHSLPSCFCNPDDLI